MRTTFSLVFMSLCTGAFGCVASDESIDESANDLVEEPADPTQIRIAPLLAEVEVSPGHSIFFNDGVDLAPDGTVWLSESIPAGGVTLSKGARELGATSLEIFMALAPDVEPDNHLEISHDREVERLGRPDHHPRRFDLAELQEVAPRSHNCSSYNNFLLWWQGVNGGGHRQYQWCSGDTTFSEFTTTYNLSENGGCNYSGGNKGFSTCTNASGSPYWSCSTQTIVSAGNTYYAERNCTNCYFTFKTHFNGSYGNARMIWDLED